MSTTCQQAVYQNKETKQNILKQYFRQPILLVYFRLVLKLPVEGLNYNSAFHVDIFFTIQLQLQKTLFVLPEGTVSETVQTTDDFGKNK